MGETFKIWEPYSFAFGEYKSSGIQYLTKIRTGENRFFHAKIMREPCYDVDQGDDDETV
jgi:hypothetical protein